MWIMGSGAGVTDLGEYVVGAAVWAPSVHNTQPWLFTADEREISLYADPFRRLAADPQGREMMISCGAALFTARLALRSLGIVPQAEVLPDPAQPLLIARLSWTERAAPANYERRLYEQVTSRRTHRAGFEPVPVAGALLTALRAGAERDGAALRVIAGEGDRAVLAAAVQAAERTLRQDDVRMRDTAAWASAPGSGRRDGVPVTAYPAHPDPLFPDFPGRDFGRGHGWGMPPSSAQRFARSAGLVCLLITAADRPADWVRAGQALQRILLTSTAYGVAAALHSQPLEFEEMRQFIGARFCSGGYPQLLLRLGVVAQTGASVRRPATDVLIPAGLGDGAR